MSTMETIIQEWQARPIPRVIHRDMKMELTGKIAPAIIGMRRSGKTWRLFQEMERLVGQGVDPASILYFNFDDERLLLREGNSVGLLDELVETFFRLNPACRRTGARFFLDEIQEVPGWAKFARRILDTENIRLCLSGSSAKLLSSEIATEFRGRSFPFELLPFSFREYLRYHGSPEKPSILERSQYEQSFNRYLEEGGFPEAFPQENSFVRIGLLQNYLDMVVLRDILERHGLTNVRGIQELAHILVSRNANLVSVNRLAALLASRDIPMGREMCAQVCAHLEDAFLVFFVPLYSHGLQRARVNPQKVYAIDPGLAFALSPAPALNLGQRLEQAVYLELRRRYPLLRQGGISYYLTKTRHEVDFILGESTAAMPKALFQACLSLQEPETRERKVRALMEAMEELRLREATIVTLYEREEIATDTGTITVVPAWDWFLSDAPPG